MNFYPKCCRNDECLCWIYSNVDYYIKWYRRKLCSDERLYRDQTGCRWGAGGDLKKIELPSKCIESLKLSYIKLNKIFKMLILRFNIILKSKLLSLYLKKACVNFNKNIYLLKLYFEFTTIFLDYRISLNFYKNKKFNFCYN